jgi:alcohol dehydrogenase class IV
VNATSPFRWQDGERLIVFGRGRLSEARELLGGDGYTLLSTPRASDSAPALVDGAGAVHEVASGRVDDVAASLRDLVDGELLVALGGGRVIDVAKALAAADPPRRVAAIPTTLSGAEMTSVHRHATGVPFETARVRPAIVLNDPALCASQPVAALAESAGNALGHAVEGPLTSLRNPVAALAALEAARLIGGAFALDRGGTVEPDRDALALGALLAGYVIGSTHYGLHHILAQTLARFAGVGHGHANVIMLPVSLGALARRFPDEVAQFGKALGADEGADAASGADAVAAATRLRALAGVTRLREATSAGESVLEQCAEEAAARPELHLTPPPADRDELLALYRAAW